MLPKFDSAAIWNNLKENSVLQTHAEEGGGGGGGEGGKWRRSAGRR